jgi:membrane protein required for colicin V production
VPSWFNARCPPSAMNAFDAVVCILTIAAVVTGFKAGLLRSTATIVAYVSAMPIAVAVTRLISNVPMDKSYPLWAQNSLVFVAIFLATAIVLGALLRTAISETVGSRISLPDRFAGSVLGAVRIGLVAVTVVAVWDRLIPMDQQPAFLNGSHLRPLLSIAGQQSIKSLPRDVTEFVDQLKRDRRA